MGDRLCSFAERVLEYFVGDYIDVDDVVEGSFADSFIRLSYFSTRF